MYLLPERGMFILTFWSPCQIDWLGLNKWLHTNEQQMLMIRFDKIENAKYAENYVKLNQWTQIGEDKNSKENWRMLKQWFIFIERKFVN